MTVRSMTAFAAATVLFAATGCDKPPPPTAVEKPAGASTSGITDPAAMRALVQSERGGPTPAANAQLPADHPPIGGAPAGGGAAPAPAGGGGADALPPGHPPIDGGAAPAPAPAPAAGGALPPGHPPLGGAPAELKFDTPAGWTAQPPAAGMGRKAQYVISKVEGDPEDGEAVVFFFGTGQGGNVALNLDRWRGMFSGPDGAPLPAEAAKTETFEAGPMKITLLDVVGRYTPSSMGRPQGGPKDNYRMLGAVIETPGGNWFVRATGPNATMEKNRAAMIEFLKSAKQ
ncbi:MAG: hypothetical protein AMXMBFR47_37530 [Planctomycetota bacterium]